MQRVVRTLSIAFVLNLIWEISHSFLYSPHFAGVADFMKVHVRVTLGDTVVVFVIFLLDIFVFTKTFSEKELGWKRITSIMLSGFIWAVAVEKYALATGRWSYKDLMPIVPFLKIGLTPLVQMTLITPFSIFIGAKDNRSNR